MRSAHLGILRARGLVGDQTFENIITMDRCRRSSAADKDGLECSPCRESEPAGTPRHQMDPVAAAGSIWGLAIANLVPPMAEQGEDDDEAIEELHVESGQAHAYDPGLDERDGQGTNGATDDRADAAPRRGATNEDG